MRGDRVTVSPAAPVAADEPRPLEAPPTSRERADRTPLGDRVIPPEGPSPLESAPDARGARLAVGDRPAPPEGPSPLEAVPDARGDRLAVGDRPAPPDGPSPIEAAPDARGERMATHPGAVVPDAGPGAPLALSPDRSERLNVGDRPLLIEVPSPIEAADRVTRARGPVSAAAPLWVDGGPGAELALSADRGDRSPLGDRPAEPKGPSPLESAAETVVGADQRIRVDERPRLATAGSTAEGASRTSADPGDRLNVGDRPVEDLSAGSTAEGAGAPAREGRLPVGDRPVPPTAPSTSEAAVALSADRGLRMNVADRPEVDEAATSSLEPALALGGSADQRLPVGDRPVPPEGPSPVESAANTVADRSARAGRPSPEALEAVGAELPLSRDRADRAGRPALADVPELDGVFQPSVRREDRIAPVPEPPAGAAEGPEPGGAVTTQAGRLVNPALSGDPGRDPVPNGLDGVMPQPYARGSERLRMAFEAPPPDDETEADGRTPIAPRRMEVMGRLTEAERYDERGRERFLVKEQVSRHIDYIFQRYELLVVRRGVYTAGGFPDGEPYPCRNPHLLAGDVPLGNGMLAQLIAGRYGDHLTLKDFVTQLGRIGFVIEEKELNVAIDRASDAAGRAVWAQMTAELEADKKRVVDGKPVTTRRTAGKRLVQGELRAVQNDEHQLLVHQDKGAAPPPLAEATGRRAGQGTAAWDLALERFGWNRAGVWASTRRRFFATLVTHPKASAYALFLLYAIENARSVDPNALAERHTAFHAWLSARRAEFDEPETGFDYAVVHALHGWDRMRLLDGAGRPVPEPELRRFPKGWSPAFELVNDVDLERMQIWASVVGSCRALGIRPWEYLADLLQAAATDRFDDPARWTPAAWARTTRP